jgi:hypothetical protein
MPRPFNRRQARENAAFVRLLAETGNVELAARECGLHKPTLYSRRKVNGAFAAEWEAALVHAQARLRGDPATAARAGRQGALAGQPQGAVSLPAGGRRAGGDAAP